MSKTQLQLIQARAELLAKGYLFVSLAELEQYRTVMPISMVSRISSAILKGENEIPVKPSQLSALREKLAKYAEQQRLMAQCVELNNRGIAYEQADNIEAAIQVYEQNIAAGYPAHHAFKRLLVLYRKAKDYKNELRVAQRACRVFPATQRQAYIDRRDKVKELLNKARK